MTYTQNLKHSALKKIVLIGASTGGPGQIEKIIKSLPVLHNSAIVIAQHMATGFLPSFSKRLQEHSLNNISVVEPNERLLHGHIYVCSGLTSVHKSGSTLIFSQCNSHRHSFNPDINTLFNSFVPFTHEVEILSVILTGIGEDGVDGCKNLTLHGSAAITESAKSAIVDGMPARARKEVENIKVYEIDEIVTIIKEFSE